MPTVQPPRGMRDFLPDVKERREGLLQLIRECFASYGYREIETPIPELIQRLATSDSGDNEKLIFRILRRGLDPRRQIQVSEAADLGLRFDLTLPLARFIATHHGEIPTVMRTAQIGPVFRGEAPQAGRYRQLVQADIDCAGEPSHLAEMEVLATGCATLKRLGIDGVTVRLNDRRALHSLLRYCDFPAERATSVLVALDKVDKVGAAGVRQELAASGFDHAPIDRLMATLEAARGDDASDDSAAAIQTMARFCRDDVLTRLISIRAGVMKVLPSVTVRLACDLCRGLGYYDGPVFELSHPASHGAVAGGGRYDGLISRFLGVSMPACGLSLGFDRIADLATAAVSQGPERVALIYEPGAAPGVLIGLQHQLVGEGYSVRLVERPARLGRVLDALAKERFGKFAIVGADTTRRADLELRPLDVARPSG